jgi:Fe-Mn family superoxide dismutase
MRMLHLSRRQLLRGAGAGVAALALYRLAPLASLAAEGDKAGFTLPPLPYPYDALEPHIDTETMKIHHDRHHGAYVNNLNAALKDQPELLKKGIAEILANINSVPEGIRQNVINNGGGHANHSIFWVIMGPRAGGQPTGPLAKAIDERFGSFDKFQKDLSTAGATQFGSGWAWLVADKSGKLEIRKRANQDSPYMVGDTPLMGVDVWEHAYYLKYKNERPKYITAWWNVVNWKEVANRHEAALKLRR